MPFVGSFDTPHGDAELIDIVIPTYNEASVLKRQIDKLVEFLALSFPIEAKVTIVDNGSTDGTVHIAEDLANTYEFVSVIALDRKGRGGAIREAWMSSQSTICCYMDVDMSTELSALLPLIAPLMTGHSDLAIGNRFGRTSNIARGPKRELISRTYNLIIRLAFAVRFSDAQCGFKAIRTDLARELLPEVRNDQWFFDTELLLLAEHNGLRVHEIAVDWIDDPDSRVRIRSTALEDMRGLLRMAITFIRGRGKVDLGEHRRPVLKNDLGRQLVSFAKIGFISTVTSLVLFLICVQTLHPVTANLLALIATTPLNFWFNRRFTFGHRTRSDRGRRYVAGVANFVGLALVSTFFLAITDTSSHLVSAVVASTCWIASSVVRFVMLRSWVFKRQAGVSVYQPVR